MSVLYTTLLLASVSVFQVSAIGFCNNTLIKNILATNKFCPSDTPMLQIMHEQLKGALSFRVMTKKYAEMYSCASIILEEPKNNVATLYTKFSYKNTSIPPLYINYTITESTCGLAYKHDVARLYVSFKMAFGYYDDISIGYYGCTNENTSTLDVCEQYAQCFTKLSDKTTPEIEESLRKCKEHMESIVPGSELVVIPPCDNNNPYKPLLEKKKHWYDKIFG